MATLGRVAVPGMLVITAAAAGRRAGMSNMVRSAMRDSDLFFSRGL